MAVKETVRFSARFPHKLFSLLSLTDFLFITKITKGERMLFVLSYFVGDPTHGIYPPCPREQNTSSVCLLLGTIIFI